MMTVLHDVRHSLRAMRRRPGTAILAVLTLGLGIAASTAMFSVLDTVLLRPLPYPEPERVVSIYTRNPELAGHPTLGFAADRGSFSYPEMRVVREESAGVLDGAAIVMTGGAVMYGAGEPERIPLGVTNPDLFSLVLRIPPAVGRVFTDEDERTNANVVVLTEGFWRDRFGGDADVVGSTLRFGDEPFEVIGVLPYEARVAGYDVSAWVLQEPNENWGNHNTGGVARLAPGVTLEQAAERLSAVLAAALPAGHGQHGISLFPRHADETRSASGPVWLLAFASLVLLLVACGNVAVLLVGAAIDREQELAVRAALGARRGRLIGQLLTESLLLGGAAAVVGVLLAHGATRILTMLAPSGVPRIGDAAVDLRVLLFAAVTALACSLLFGLVPALKFSRTDLRSSASIAMRGSTAARSRTQMVLVVSELALATLLLVGAGLLVRTFLALNAVDPGFAAQSTLALRMTAPSSRIAPEADGDSARFAALSALYDRVAEELATVPGVSGVAMTTNLPLSADRSNNDVTLEGLDEAVLAERRFVSAEYFDVMGIRLIEGRSFTAAEDRAGADGTAVISAGLARRAYPDGSAVGRRLRYWGDRETVIVGVAADIRDEGLQSETTYAFYVPRRQAGQSAATFVMRTSVDPVSLTRAVRQRVRSVHDAIAIIAVQPLSELVSDQIANERYRARLVTVFALLAALFSIMGVYGVTARGVAARMRELGIRMALGARPAGILKLIIVQALRLGLIGAAAGILISLLATRTLESYLWGVARADLITLSIIAALLAIASALAALLPARRASRVDPQTALRAE
jgi:putative ABC transport system permease protein